MAEPRFKPCLQDQPMLLPPTFDDIIEPDCLIRVVDHFVRSLDRNLLECLYPGGGASAYDPQMMLKVILYCYASGIYSSRKIAKATKTDINLLWVCGMKSLDHNTINRFRSERIRPVFEEVFANLVLMLADADYINLTTYFVDGTKIEANANKFSFVWSKATEGYTEKLRLKVHELLDAIDKINDEEEALAPKDPKEIDASTLHEVADKVNARLKARLEKGPENGECSEGKSSQDSEHEIKELSRLAKSLEKDFIPRMERYEEQAAIADGRNSYSKTDHDATFMRMKEDHHNNNASPKAAYNVQVSASNQYAIGVSLHQASNDLNLAIPHLSHLFDLYGWMPSVVCADAGYGSEENYLWLEGVGIKALVAHPESHRLAKRSYRDNPFRSVNWPYDELIDAYICPEGRPLSYLKDETTKTATGFEQHISIYASSDCSDCTCTKECRGRYADSPSPRSLHINPRLDKLKEEANDLLASPCGSAIYSKRKDDVETFFGDIKQNMGFKRFSLRGLAKVTHEFLLVAIGHNLRKVTKAIKDSGKSLIDSLKPRNAGKGLA